MNAQAIRSPISIRNDFKFYWMESDGEISGFVQDPDGNTVPGSNGWYRTSDPLEAAKRAQARFVQPPKHNIR